jgi:hypothetical protein
MQTPSPPTLNLDSMILYEVRQATCVKCEARTDSAESARLVGIKLRNEALVSCLHFDHLRGWDTPECLDCRRSSRVGDDPLMGGGVRWWD